MTMFWSRVDFFRLLKSLEMFRILMAKYGFYILSGPWGRLWCRFGYDPKKTPDAKRYQTIMVSFRKHTKIPERQRLKVNQDRQQPAQSAAIDYAYNPGTSTFDDFLSNPKILGHLPAIRQMWYSVCDIKLPAAQKLLRTDFYGTLKECDPNSGWLPPVSADLRGFFNCRVEQDCLRSITTGGQDKKFRLVLFWWKSLKHLWSTL